MIFFFFFFFFCRISELMLATLIQRYDKKNHFISKTNFTDSHVPHFMIVLIPYINLLNISWIIKSLFLRNMEPLRNCADTGYP